MDILSKPLLTPLSINQMTMAQPSAAAAPVAAAAGQPTDHLGPAYLVDLSGKGKELARGKGVGKESSDAAAAESIGGSAGTKAVDKAACQTCKNRKYQDGSNDAGVSFKTPGHIAPGNSAATVMGHEQEHVSAARARQDEDTKLVSASVRLYTATCPECGRIYTAGGETQTVMKTTLEQDVAAKKGLGRNVDIAA